MDTIVIGGGCMGASIAYHLARAGERGLVLLERHGLATGNTGKSGSIVRQHYANPGTAAMARAALPVFQHWGERIGGDCGFHTTGLLVLADEAHAPLLRDNVRMQRRLGIDVTLLDDPATARELAPQVNLAGVAGAAWEADAGYADPIATTGAFAAAAARLGVDIRLGTPATAIRLNAGRVAGVETPGGFLPAGRVVLATNAWANELLTPLGRPLPIAPSRHAILALHNPPGFHPPLPILFSLPDYLYLRPDGNLTTLAGSSDPADGLLPADPDHYHEGLLAAEVAHYRAATARLVPALARGVVRGGWAGVYDVTPDWQPIIGPAPGLDGLYLAVGFSGHGFKLAPAVGDWLTHLILTGDHPGLADFAPARFPSGTPPGPAQSGQGVLG